MWVTGRKVANMTIKATVGDTIDRTSPHAFLKYSPQHDIVTWNDSMICRENKGEKGYQRLTPHASCNENTVLSLSYVIDYYHLLLRWLKPDFLKASLFGISWSDVRLTGLGHDEEEKEGMRDAGMVVAWQRVCEWRQAWDRKDVQ